MTDGRGYGQFCAWLGWRRMTGLPAGMALMQAGQSLPVGTLIDAEIVIADEDGCVDFTALQARLSSARKQVSRTAFERAAVLVAFDALEIHGATLRDDPLSVRREHLARLLAARHPCIQLVEQTADVDLAREWLRFVSSIEGVVAKRADRRYAPDRGRDWLKVKRYRTIDCVVIGVAGEWSAPKLVLGLQHADGAVHHLGRVEVSSVTFNEYGVGGERAGLK